MGQGSTDDDGTGREAVVAPSSLPRRAVVVAAAWTVPALGVVVATPAAAASAEATATLAFTGASVRPAGDALSDAMLTVLSGSGTPSPGETVVFSVSGPAFFGTPGTTTATAVTDAAGQATATGLVASLDPGVIVLTASVAGLPPAVAQVTTTPVLDLAVTDVGNAAGSGWQPFVERPLEYLDEHQQWLWQSGRTYSVTTAFSNAGPDAPAGAVVRVVVPDVLPAGGALVSAARIVAFSATATALGMSAATVTPRPVAPEEGFAEDFVVAVPIPAGAAFGFTVALDVRPVGVERFAYNSVVVSIATGVSDDADRDTADDTMTSAPFAMDPAT
ncbi:hypothetical protein DEI93_11415 [Curtobacterium sp. MCBD17_035]|uniref:hypothetical protein n=1 Tax=Curtobacterium sp. MCBD17_035 TaxID=2175673 RepID=UPI000DA72ECE|nr:hypothetical protein [Curtobacterium sp. MCBD17_035]WIB66574.1 hypothetical protein DEI93_11415 [Curtobacterium sp. MCBD17_035]